VQTSVRIPDIYIKLAHDAVAVLPRIVLGLHLAAAGCTPSAGRDHPTCCFFQSSLFQPDARVLEMTMTKGDQTVARGQYELSDDGATLTVSTADHVVVFERA
jgi:hypothetical protein